MLKSANEVCALYLEEVYFCSCHAALKERFQNNAATLILWGDYERGKKEGEITANSFEVSSHTEISPSYQVILYKRVLGP